MATPHVRAVYSPKPPITGKKLVEAAGSHDFSLRLLLPSGGIPSDPAAQLKNLKAANAGAMLIAGATTKELAALETFDRIIESKDRKAMNAMLNEFQLPWIELYSGDFNYDRHLKIFANDRENLDKAVPAEQQPLLKAARSRYIISNQSRNSRCKTLMVALTEIIAAATEGMIADHRIPKR